MCDLDQFVWSLSIHMDTSSMRNCYMLHTVSYGQGKGVYGYEVMALGDHMVSIILYHG